MAKILIMMHHLGGGGAEKMLALTLGHWDYASFDVTLLTSDREGARRISADIPRLKVLYLKDIYHSFVLRNLFYRVKPLRGWIMKLNWRRAARLVGDCKYDVALSYLEGHSAQLHQGLMQYAARNVSWVHCDFRSNHWSARYFISEAAEKAFYRALDETVFVSGYARDSFLEFLPELGRNRVVHNCIDAREIQALSARMTPARSERFTMVSVGRLIPAKRFDRLLQVVGRMKESGRECDLWILGEGKLEGELRRLAESLCLADNVRFWGFQPNPYPYVKVADVFVSSSDSEGYGLVLGEALCLGKPIVATAVGGTTEVLDPDECLFVPPDVQTLFDACCRLADNPSLREEMARKALASSARFSVDEYMRQFSAAVTGN